MKKKINKERKKSRNKEFFSLFNDFVLTTLTISD